MHHLGHLRITKCDTRREAHSNLLFRSPSVIACAALAFLLTPLCQYMWGGGAGAARVIVCGRYTAPELAATALAAGIVGVWVLTGHWLLMDGTSLWPLHRSRDGK